MEKIVINPNIKKQLMNDLDKLPIYLQKKVQDFAHALPLSQPTGVSGKEVVKLAGSISKKDAQKILKVVEEDCGKVDLDEW